MYGFRKQRSKGTFIFAHPFFRPEDRYFVITLDLLDFRKLLTKIKRKTFNTQCSEDAASPQQDN